MKSQKVTIQENAIVRQCISVEETLAFECIKEIADYEIFPQLLDIIMRPLEHNRPLGWGIDNYLRDMTTIRAKEQIRLGYSYEDYLAVISFFKPDPMFKPEKFDMKFMDRYIGFDLSLIEVLRGVAVAVYALRLNFLCRKKWKEILDYLDQPDNREIAQTCTHPEDWFALAARNKIQTLS